MISRRGFLYHAGLALSASTFVTLGGCARRLAAEFVIVGSGPAGIALADRLAQAGRQVLVLEGGTRQPDPALQAMHEVEAGRWPPSYPYGRTTQRLLGGTSNLWQGHSPRPLAIELAAFSLRGVGEDWPLTLEQLTPWLAQAEAWLRVRPADPAMNPTLPRNPYIDSSRLLQRRLSDAGYQHLQPSAYGMVAREGLDALRLLEDGEIDRVAALNSVALRPGTSVRRLRLAGRRVAALECADLSGNPLTVEAGTVIVCAGGIQTPRLLWNSGDGDAAPGNHSDWLGAGFMDHPGVQMFGQPATPLMVDSDTDQATLHVRDMLYDPAGHGLSGTLLQAAIRRGKEGREYAVIEALFEQSPDRHNRIRRGQGRDALGDPLARLDYRLNELDQRSIKHGYALQKTLAGAVGPMQSRSPLRVSSHHLMGSTRMARDPAQGVVDTELRVWQTDNLYLASSSVFPTALTVPPTLILVALAQRLASTLLTKAGD